MDTTPTAAHTTEGAEKHLAAVREQIIAKNIELQGYKTSAFTGRNPDRDYGEITRQENELRDQIRELEMQLPEVQKKELRAACVRANLDAFRDWYLSRHEDRIETAITHAYGAIKGIRDVTPSVYVYKWNDPIYKLELFIQSAKRELRVSVHLTQKQDLEFNRFMREQADDAKDAAELVALRQPIAAE